jgi:hypothetical protein
MAAAVKYMLILDTLRNAYRQYNAANPGKPQKFLLIHPNDYEKLCEVSPANADRIYSVPVIISALIPEHAPQFVT